MTTTKQIHISIIDQQTEEEHEMAHARQMVKRFFPSYIHRVGQTINAVYRVNKNLACRMTMKALSIALRKKLKDRDHKFYASGKKELIRWKRKKFYTYSYGSGPAVLLVHGWCSNGAHWQTYVPKLVARGYKAVVIDAPGHGQSPGRWLSVPDFIQCVGQVLRREAQWAAILGHSMGSLTSVIAAAETNRIHPDMKFVLQSTFADCDALMSKFALCLGVAPHVLQATREWIPKYTYQSLDYFSMKQHFPSTGTNGLLQYDLEDIVVPQREARQLMEQLPGLSYEPSKGLGHNLRSNQVIERALAFLAPDV